MNKRGEGLLSIEWLTATIPKIIVVILLIAIFALFLIALFSTEQSKEQRDFSRIVAEIKEYVDMDYQGYADSIRVPIDSDSKLDVVLFPSDDSPDVCQDKACVCIYYREGDRTKEECEIYKTVENTCSADCDDVCFARTQRLTLEPDATVITIKRECNVISFG